MIGLNVSHYRVLEKVGQGGMGVVYRAQDVRLDRVVALKVLPPDVCNDPSRRRRFEQEARAAAALSHNAIATVYDFEQDGDNLYIVMEYVEGASLRALLREAPVPLPTLLSIATQVAQGLAAAHLRGIVHRDLKPENILWTASGQIKILDFGLCRFAPTTSGLLASVTLTDPGVILGTLAYMSPEQLEGRETDVRTDIFSFGVLLYELATGVHPFAGSSPASTIANVINIEPVPLAKLSPTLPSQLPQVICKCLQKSPARRYASMAELLADLEQLRQIKSGNLNRPPLDEGHGEETLLRRWLPLRELTPRRWWEVNQLLCLFAYPAVAYLGWRLRGWLPHEWEAMLIASMVILVASTTTMRMYLLLTGAFDPSSLRGEVERWSKALRGTSIAIWLLLASMAATFFRQHTGVAALLWGLAAGGFLSTVVAEAAIDNKAFADESRNLNPE